MVTMFLPLVMTVRSCLHTLVAANLSRPPHWELSAYSCN